MTKLLTAITLFTIITAIAACGTQPYRIVDWGGPDQQDAAPDLGAPADLGCAEGAALEGLAQRCPVD